jgi:hypothetical protein
MEWLAGDLPQAVMAAITASFGFASEGAEITSKLDAIDNASRDPGGARTGSQHSAYSGVAARVTPTAPSARQYHHSGE